jgi:deferrochelatase/peroxidase EfeB
VNLFGFTEGHGNPDPHQLTDVVRVREGQGEPGWAIGGSYQVARTITFGTALWDADKVHEQERVIGRRRDGRWLNGSPAGADPDFAADPDGRHTPLNAHVRMARAGGVPPMLRRGYSYRLAAEAGGAAEEGLIFLAYQHDLAKGFEAVQKRLAGEKLARYVLTVGGGYFFVPPASRDGRWWGEGLFT